MRSIILGIEGNGIGGVLYWGEWFWYVIFLNTLLTVFFVCYFLSLWFQDNLVIMVNEQINTLHFILDILFPGTLGYSFVFILPIKLLVLPLNLVFPLHSFLSICGCNLVGWGHHLSSWLALAGIVDGHQGWRGVNWGLSLHTLTLHAEL